MSNKKFYIQDKRQYVGNSIMWFAKGGNGYTTDIDKAEIFTKDDAVFLTTVDPDKYRAWSCKHINEHISRHVDMQHVDYRYSIDEEEK